MSHIGLMAHSKQKLLDSGANIILIELKPEVFKECLRFYQHICI